MTRAVGRRYESVVAMAWRWPEALDGDDGSDRFEPARRIPPATARLLIVDSATKKNVRNRQIPISWSVLAENSIGRWL